MMRTYHTDVTIDCRNSLIRAWLQKLGADDLLDCQHDAIFAPDADRGTAVFDRLYCILDLEVAAIWGEYGVG
jgi:hypothetical protein